MAAPTQTDANKSGLQPTMEATSEGVIMQRIFGILIGAGTNSPNGEVTAPRGSLFIDVDGATNDDPNIWQNTDGSTTWELVGTQTS